MENPICRLCGKEIEDCARPDIVETHYSCAIEGKDLTPKKFITNLNFVPKQSGSLGYKPEEK